MKILNITTGEVYRTISEAARAVGVDPSNVGKVLRGKRQQAGGYRFQYTREENPKKAYQQQLRSVQEAIRAANDVIREYKRAGVYSIGSAVGELLELGDLVGLTGRGYIRSSYSNLKQLFPEIQDIKDLMQLERRLQILTEKAQSQLETAIQEQKDLADQFGISQEKMKEYMPLMPEIFDLLSFAGKDQAVGSNRVYSMIEDAMQNYVKRAELRNLVRRIETWFKDDERKADELDQIYSKWEKKTLKKEGKEPFKFKP